MMDKNRNTSLTITRFGEVEFTVLNRLYGDHGVNEYNDHHHRSEEGPAHAPVQ